MASSRRHGAATPSTRPPHAVFGTKDKFTKYYEGPILRGREPDATDKQKKLGKARRDLGVPSCGGAFTSLEGLVSISQ